MVLLILSLPEYLKKATPDYGGLLPTSCIQQASRSSLDVKTHAAIVLGHQVQICARVPPTCQCVDAYGCSR